MNETTVADENTLFGSYRKWSEVTLWRYAVGLGYDSSSLGQNVEGQKMNIFDPREPIPRAIIDNKRVVKSVTRDSLMDVGFIFMTT